MNDQDEFAMEDLRCKLHAMQCDLAGTKEAFFGIFWLGAGVCCVIGILIGIAIGWWFL